MKPLALVMLIGIMTFIAPAPALAQGGCDPRGETADMAGIYVSPESLMRVTVLGCSIINIRWTNDYGDHEAYYRLAERMPDFLVAKCVSGPVGLDARQTIGVKPAEPGFIQVFTMSPYGTDLREYRLLKIG